MRIVPRWSLSQTWPHCLGLQSLVEVDGWLKAFEGFHVERKVDAHGQVHLDLRGYDVDVHRVGQRVTLQIEAESRSLLIWHEGALLKTVPLRGFKGGNVFL